MEIIWWLLLRSPPAPAGSGFVPTEDLNRDTSAFHLCFSKEGKCYQWRIGCAALSTNICLQDANKLIFWPYKKETFNLYLEIILPWRVCRFYKDSILHTLMWNSVNVRCRRFLYTDVSSTVTKIREEKQLILKFWPSTILFGPSLHHQHSTRIQINMQEMNLKKPFK